MQDIAATETRQELSVCPFFNISVYSVFSCGASPSALAEHNSSKMELKIFHNRFAIGALTHDGQLKSSKSKGARPFVYELYSTLVTSKSKTLPQGYNTSCPFNHNPKSLTITI